MHPIEHLVRPAIRRLTPYSSARDEFDGQAEIWLDANENPFPNGFNRYPDPHQQKLKQQLAELKGISPENIFLGNGSDEAVDLLIRAFCEPGKDRILLLEPTYGMYKVCAAVNDVGTEVIRLNPDFQLDESIVNQILDSDARIVFLCSPNNPSGNLLDTTWINKILQSFRGLVVIDEAYIDFSGVPGFVDKAGELANLVVLQTLSKAWGGAGLRMGMAFSNSYVISILNKIKYPYNISTYTQQAALELLREKDVAGDIRLICQERSLLVSRLSELPMVVKVFPSDANFLLVRFQESTKVFSWLLQHGVVVRDRSTVPGCEGCLRITVGQPEENARLLHLLKQNSHL